MDSQSGQPELDSARLMVASAAGMKVGIDFDGVIDKYPEVIATLAGIIGLDNCYLITARCKRDEARTMEEAVKLGFPLEALAGRSFYDGEYNYETMDGVPGLWDELVAYKVAACKSLGVALMIEDDLRYKGPMEAEGIQFLLVGQK